jgi:hypothetical protein
MLCHTVNSEIPNHKKWNVKVETYIVPKFSSEVVIFAQHVLNHRPLRLWIPKLFKAQYINLSKFSIILGL